jgi:hypothetical protein
MGRIAYTWNKKGRYIGVKISRNKNTAGEHMLPGSSTWEKPFVKPDETALWTSAGWKTYPDWSKRRVWRKDNAQEGVVPNDYAGRLPDEFTLVSPETTPFPQWDGKQWVTDEKKSQENEAMLETENRQQEMRAVELKLFSLLVSILPTLLEFAPKEEKEKLESLLSSEVLTAYKENLTKEEQMCDVTLTASVGGTEII